MGVAPRTPTAQSHKVLLLLFVHKRRLHAGYFYSVGFRHAIRDTLEKRGTKSVIPNKRNRKQPFSFSKKSYKERHKIENAFCRLKDFRRIATRYDRLAINFAASIYLLAAIVWWVL